jgi:hypothetical protein
LGLVERMSLIFNDLPNAMLEENVSQRGGNQSSSHWKGWKLVSEMSYTNCKHFSICENEDIRISMELEHVF